MNLHQDLLPRLGPLGPEDFLPYRESEWHRSLTPDVEAEHPANLQQNLDECPPHTPPGVADLLYADLVQSPPFGHNRPHCSRGGARKNRLSRNKNVTFQRTPTLRNIPVLPVTTMEHPPLEKSEKLPQQTENAVRGKTAQNPCSQQLEHRDNPR